MIPLLSWVAVWSPWLKISLTFDPSLVYCLIRLSLSSSSVMENKIRPIAPRMFVTLIAFKIQACRDNKSYQI